MSSTITGTLTIDGVAVPFSGTVPSGLTGPTGPAGPPGPTGPAGSSGGAPPPVTVPTVIAPSTATITDSAGNAWGINATGQVTVNGTADTTTASVIEIAYVAGILWQENASKLWWGKTAPTAAWLPTNGTTVNPTVVGAVSGAGPTGPTGATGAQGIPGPTGPAGSGTGAGDVGPTGPTGSAGAPGAAGKTGPTGAQGIPGPTGPAGSGTGTSTVGPTGPTGAQGPAGPAGGSGSSLTITAKTASYTLTMADAADDFITMNGSNLTLTIPANASVPLPAPTLFTVYNLSTTPLKVAITTDKLTLTGTTTTGTRTVAPNGQCNLVKLAATAWFASGVGVT
jgi:hypothetical protein